MSTYEGSDTCLNIVLDFIAGGVPGNRIGESKGNYNAVIGNADAKEDLSKKVITEIYSLQQKLLDAKMPSTAIGRYQFLRGTLKRLIIKLKILESENFKPELQDRLALELLLESGYENWWKSNISDEAFANKLSTVWASLPDPQNNGKSHYDGDSAGNHASTGLNDVYYMLKGAKGTVPLDQQKSLAREFIKNIQRILEEYGSYTDNIDGLFGPKSRSALSSLLAADGQAKL